MGKPGRRPSGVVKPSLGRQNSIQYTFLSIFLKVKPFNIQVNKTLLQEEREGDLPALGRAILDGQVQSRVVVDLKT